MEEKKQSRKQIAEQKEIAAISDLAKERNLDEEELIQSITLMSKHKKIILRSAKKLSEYDGTNYAPILLGNLILVLLQLSEYDDPEYLHSALISLIDIYKQATRDYADPSDLFEIMAATSLLEKNNNSNSE